MEQATGPTTGKDEKVLLRERKRHTDRGVSSTTQDGVPPYQGTPPPRPGPTGGYLRWGTPHWGTPWPGPTGGGTWLGYPPAGPGRGTPLPPGPGRGTPPPQVWTDRIIAGQTRVKHNLPSYYVRGR